MRENYYNKKKLKYLEMLRSGKAKKNSRGDIIKDAPFQNSKADVGRIEPSRKWFTGSKTISSTELDAFRLETKIESPYNVLLSTGKVPYSLLEDGTKKKKRGDFEEVFGKRSVRKKPNLQYSSLEELSQKAKEAKEEKKEVKKDHVKGQSHRIWLELYKVLDSSDVIVHVLDARDPLGTMCDKIASYIKEEAPHKHLMYVLNKVDLVPTGVTAKWLKRLSKSHPTIAYHSNSVTNNYGKASLINLLKQLSKLYKKRHLSVGFVGYPNTGKSSIINTLRNKEVCKVAPIPGETKVWQYIALTRGIYLIDCPGIVPIPDYDQAVLRGAVRIENIEDPEDYIDMIVEKARDSISKTYRIQFLDSTDLLERLAIKFGKLQKGGEPNTNTVSKMILHDWVRGKIPYFVPPKEEDGDEEK
ncbi:GTP-binding protein [Encephalitozoon intestinalis ATCC 50506]|uniref:Nucleolar GTP-binding protein 2 n=1 Tax=Encephalitozoon intestinalis (strain ATCC 50506) TaxID=876142 RepID=E0S938_ENCIT|nr:GTP-binding protein [Encephalitozoon intestinalis ATCC 50506]ADM12294.1 GTP-binding protein [Encephalitozoon intestinalis ATCC 50506]UTX46104.1 nucleolar GTP-binding protein 2 [Encephalitozoon intestinalis]